MDNLTVSLRSSGGETLTFSGSSPYRILEGGLTGTDGAETELSSFAGNGDGAKVTGAKLAPREVTLRFEASCGDNAAALRRALCGFFSPQKTYTLSITRAGAERTLSCRHSGEVTFTEYAGGQFFTVSVTLYAGDPCFYGPEKTASPTVTEEGLLYAPLTLTPEGLTVSAVSPGDRISFVNGGDTDTGFAWTAETEEGCVNPCISLGEERLCVLTSLSPGDVLTVSTVRGGRTVRKNGEPCNLLSSGSRFFTLPTGTGVLCFTCDSGSFRSAVSFRERYLGG